MCDRKKEETNPAQTIASAIGSAVILVPLLIVELVFSPFQ